MKTSAELINYLTERFAPTTHHCYEVAPQVALHTMSIQGIELYLLIARYGITTYGIANGYASSYIRAQDYSSDEEFYSLLSNKVLSMINAEAHSRLAAY